MARQIINPRWGNAQKTHILATFKYDDGRELAASITNVGDTVNPDWQEIMEKFGVEQLDQNANDALASHLKRKAERFEQQQLDRQRAEKEALFNIKADAFDMELVKNSTNRELKNKIRRATSPLEVYVYTTMLHMKESPLVNPELAAKEEDV